MAEEKNAPEESGTAESEPTLDEIWDSTESPYDAEAIFSAKAETEEVPKETPREVAETVSEPEPVPEKVEETEQEETKAEEPVHDYEKRYKDLEKEFHRRNQERKQEQETLDRLRLARLEQESQMETTRKELDGLRKFREANEKPKDPTPADDNYLSDDDRQTMNDFSEITGVVQKMIDQTIAKRPEGGSNSVKNSQDRLEKLEEHYQQQQIKQFLDFHDTSMRRSVGDNYLEIDSSAEFKAYVEGSPTKLKIMQESTDPSDHSEIMNMFLTSETGAKFRQKDKPVEEPKGSTQAEIKRQAASGIMENTAPIMEPDPNKMSEDELWDSIQV